MSQMDLFDTPAAATPAAPRRPACPRCGQPVLRVHDEQLGDVPVDPDPVPITQPITADQLVYEDHPRIGWHLRWKPQRRGYPLHLLHECPPASTSTSTSHKKEIKS